MPQTESVPSPTTSAPGSPLCVLLVVEPGLDGVFRHMEGLIGFLLKNQVRLHLAYSSRRCGTAMLQLVEQVRLAGGEVVDLHVTNYPELRDIPAFFRLISLIRRVRPDVVHTHSSKAGALGRFATKFLGHRRVFYSPHAYYGMTKPPSFKVRFYNWVERLLGGVGLTIAISEDEASFARKVLQVPADHIRVIHNPVNTTLFTPATPEKRRAARAALAIPEDVVVLAIIGRMAWQKDPETSYAGAAPVCAVNPDLRLIHLGWGKWKEYLLSLAHELGLGSQLRIVDYTDDPRGFYHAIDALIVSSRYEAGWPLVVLEALATNLPVIAATGLGMSDIGQGGLSHIWTFPPGNVSACTAAVNQWLAAHRAGIRDCNHRAFAVRRLSPERCFGAVHDLYQGRQIRGSVSPFDGTPGPL